MFLPFLLSGSLAVAAPTTVTISGKISERIMSASTQDPLAHLNVSVIGGNECLIYEESRIIDLSASSSSYNVQIGRSLSSRAQRTQRDPGLSIESVFSDNKSISGANGCLFNPSQGENRKIKVTMTVNGITEVMTPEVVIDSVPMAASAKTLDGKKSEDFLQNNSNIKSMQTSVEALATHAESILSLLNAPPVGGGPIPPGVITYPNLDTTPFINNTGVLVTNGKSINQKSCRPTELLIWNAVSGWTCATQNSLSVGNAVFAVTAGNFNGPLNGDVTGNQNSTQVTKLQGLPLAVTSPTAGQVITYNGSSFVNQNLPAPPTLPTTLPPSGAAGGDLSGSYPNPTIASNAVVTDKLFPNPGVNRLVATNSTTGATLSPITCSAGELLTWNPSLGWTCTNANSLVTFPMASTAGVTAGLLSNAEFTSFLDKANPQTITGKKTFGEMAQSSSSIFKLSSVDAGTESNYVANYGNIAHQGGIYYSQARARIGVIDMAAPKQHYLAFISDINDAINNLTNVSNATYIQKASFPSCNSTQTVFYNPVTDTFSCQTMTTSWASLSGKPTTVAGYNITDAVTSVTSANSDILVTGTTAPVLTLNSGTTANKILKLDGAAKIPAVDGSQLTGLNIGQISGAQPAGNYLTSLTGDITLSGYSAGTATASIGANKVTNTMLAGGIDLTTKVTGILPIANGGTGVNSAPAIGQMLIGNGTGYTVANLTAGYGIIIKNTAGGVTISTPPLMNSRFPAGTVINFAGKKCPEGTIAADGTSVPRTGIYENLFAAIGETHGAGNRRTTFNLPNYQNPAEKMSHCIYL